MEVTPILEGIATVGFPIYVSAYLLFRTTKQLEEVSLSINKLNDTIEKSQIEIRLNFERLREERFKNLTNKE